MIISWNKYREVESVIFQFVLCLTPLILFLPHQFYKNLYLSVPFWIVIGLGFLSLPSAFRRLRIGSVFSFPTAFVAYLIALVLAVFASVDIFLSLPILFLNLAFFFIFLASGEVLLSQKLKEVYSLVFIMVCIVLSVISYYYTVVRRFTDLTSEGLSFMWGYFGHNHLAVPLMIAIPLAVYFLMFSSKKLVRLLFAIILLIFLYSLLITFARGAIISLFLAFVVAGFVFLRSSGRKVSYKTSLSLGLVILVLGLSLIVAIGNKSIRSIYIRGAHYQKGVQMFLEKPIIGYGLGTFAYTETNSESAANKRAFYPHNLFIQAAAEGGIVLLLATIFLFFLLVRMLTVAIKSISLPSDRYFFMALWVGVLGILINEMADFDLQLPAVGMLFWLMAGLIHASRKET